MPVYWTNEAERRQYRRGLGLDPYGQSARGASTVGGYNLRGPAAPEITAPLMETPEQADLASPAISRSPTRQQAYDELVASRGAMLGRDRSTGLSAMDIKMAGGPGLSQTSKRERYLEGVRNAIMQRDVQRRAEAMDQQRVDVARERDVMMPLAKKRMDIEAANLRAGIDADTRTQIKQLEFQTRKEIADLDRAANKEIANTRLQETKAKLQQGIDAAKATNDKRTATAFAIPLFNAMIAETKTIEDPDARAVAVQDAIAQYQKNVGMAQATPATPTTNANIAALDAQTGQTQTPNTTAMLSSGEQAANMDGQPGLSPDEQRWLKINDVLKAPESAGTYNDLELKMMKEEQAKLYSRITELKNKKP